MLLLFRCRFILLVVSQIQDGESLNKRQCDEADKDRKKVGKQGLHMAATLEQRDAAVFVTHHLPTFGSPSKKKRTEVAQARWGVNG